MSGPGSVELAFFVPSPALQPYISSLYLTTIDLPPGQRITDWLLPEWASLRMARDGAGQAAIGGQAERPTGTMMATGPTSHATRITIGKARVWGVGILPLGWARLVDCPAADHADRFCDGTRDPGWAALAPLFDLAFADDPAPAEAAARMDRHLLGLLASRPAGEDEQRITAAHRWLLNDAVGTVSDLAALLDMSPRTLERFCLRAFGFSPKLLLRRQRFSRSLGQFLLNPGMTWLAALDQHYVDQAHFVRDFRRFMGMSPSAYSQSDHPLLRATAGARAAAVGGAVQALHRP